MTRLGLSAMSSSRPWTQNILSLHNTFTYCRPLERDAAQDIVLTYMMVICEQPLGVSIDISHFYPAQKGSDQTYISYQYRYGPRTNVGTILLTV